MMIEAYANSLFSLAKEESLLETFYKHFIDIEELYKDNSIKEFLTNRFVDNKEKSRIVDNYFGDFNEYFRNFLHLLIDDNKFSDLEQIKDEFIKLYYKENKIEIGIIYGVSLTQNELKKLEDTFSNKLNKKVKLIFKKDEELIGGYRVQIGSRLYDTSYQYKLNLLKQVLKKEA